MGDSSTACFGWLALVLVLLTLAPGTSARRAVNRTELMRLMAQYYGYGDAFLKTDDRAMPITNKERLKKDWCRTEPLVQKVRDEGCVSKSVVTSFCYGQCNSFYVPKVHAWRAGRRPHDYPPDEAAFASCAQCRPKRAAWLSVTLHCPSYTTPTPGEGGAPARISRRRVQRVKQCRCMASP
ncbi:gremlin-1-like [Schistocerca gregaria]|uniref:gremlin-1-like n=1 Tax=Schistocerca gregaria TaxID=7010 RepID=UPI00211E7F13|nr:gremlin-1-like [Schistocerca gregaria]